MNLDEAIELSNEVEKAYDNGFISLYSPPGKEIHLNDERFDELAEGRKVYITGFNHEWNERYFEYNGYKFFKLVERNGDSK